VKATKPRTQGHILVVDDQKNWRETIGELLRDDGHQVQAVSSLVEAREILSVNIFDVVVLDIRLVDKDRHNVQGLEVLEEIKETNDKTRILVLTGFPTPETEARVKEMGAEVFVFKSPPEGLDIPQFRQVVRGLVQQAQDVRA
jgi:CheY-like chemotaxis protein